MYSSPAKTARPRHRKEQNHRLPRYPALFLEARTKATRDTLSDSDRFPCCCCCCCCCCSAAANWVTISLNCGAFHSPPLPFPCANLRLPHPHPPPKPRVRLAICRTYAERALASFKLATGTVEEAVTRHARTKEAQRRRCSENRNRAKRHSGTIRQPASHEPTHERFAEQRQFGCVHQDDAHNFCKYQTHQSRSRVGVAYARSHCCRLLFARSLSAEIQGPLSSQIDFAP